MTWKLDCISIGKPSVIIKRKDINLITQEKYNNYEKYNKEKYNNYEIYRNAIFLFQILNIFYFSYCQIKIIQF